MHPLLSITRQREEGRGGGRGEGWSGINTHASPWSILPLNLRLSPQLAYSYKVQKVLIQPQACFAWFRYCFYPFHRNRTFDFWLLIWNLKIMGPSSSLKAAPVKTILHHLSDHCKSFSPMRNNQIIKNIDKHVIVLLKETICTYLKKDYNFRVCVLMAQDVREYFIEQKNFFPAWHQWPKNQTSIQKDVI